MNRKIYLKDLTTTKIFPIAIKIRTMQSDFKVHTHDFCEITFALGGKACHIVNGKEYDIGKGDVCVFRGETSHGYKKVENLELCNIHFDARKLLYINEELMRMPGFQALFILEPFFNNEGRFTANLKLDSAKLGYIRSLLELMCDEHNSKNEGYETLLQSYFMVVVVFLSREYSNPGEKMDKQIFLLARSLAFIENHFTEHIDIDMLAEEAAMSTRHFDRAFRKLFYTSPLDYIIGLRINFSCRLLSQTDCSVTEAALNCGFSDSNYFARTFKKRIGMSPSDFRKSKVNP